MKKFKFRLESVLKVRALHKKLAERDLAATQHKVNRNTRELEGVRDAYAQSFAAQVYDAANPAYLNEVLLHYRKGLKAREEVLAERQKELNEKLESEKKILTRRMRDEMVMDKLKDHQKQEYLRQVDLQEQSEIEEIDLLKRGNK
ncbi:MAG: hypothetical protein QNK37_16260 [Acidobacteriota bacterium]|nr:hypothetical protein [Acidobacteriota bacterium]